MSDCVQPASASRRVVAASELERGDAVMFLLGGLGHVCDITETGPGRLVVRTEVAISLRCDDVVTVFVPGQEEVY